MFRKSYQDYIRKYNANKPADNNLFSNITYLSTNVLDLSNDIEKIEYFYNHADRNNFSYSLTVECVKHDEDIPLWINYFDELYGTDGWIKTLANKNATHEDYLTGCYLAKTFMQNKRITLLYIGQNGNQLLQGFNDCMNEAEIKNYVLPYGNYPMNNLFGDIKANADDIVLNKIPTMDIANKNDIADVNTIRQLNNVLHGEGLKPNLIICDVNTINLSALYGGLITLLNNSTDEAVGCIRIPDPTEWSRIGTPFYSWILFIVMHFTYVKLLKTPWGSKPRYYLVLTGVKHKFTTSQYNNLIKYLIDYNRDKSISLIDNQTITSSKLHNVLVKILLDINTLFKYQCDTTRELVNEQWLNIMHKIEME